MKKDYLDGDHSFKMWLKLMWSNGYIFYFLLTLTAAIILIFFPGVFGFDEVLIEDEPWGRWIGLIIPVVGMILVCYKGFYQFWNDMKNGRSR